MSNRKPNNKLSVEKIEEMFDAYVENPSSNWVAQTCGVHPNTAQKYIKHGDPARGIEPFAQRCTRITQLAARRVEKRITYARADANAAAWQHLQLLDDVIIEALLRYREVLVDGKPKLGDIVQAVKVSNELKTRLEKWAEDEQAKTGDGTQLPGQLTEMTVTELEVFARTGEVPRNRVATPPALPPQNKAPVTPGDHASNKKVEAPALGDDELAEVFAVDDLTPGAIAAAVGDDAEVLDAVPGWLEPED